MLRIRISKVGLCAWLAITISASTGCFEGGGESSQPRRASAPEMVTVAYPGRLESLDPDQALNTLDLGAVHLIGGNLFELRGKRVVAGLAKGLEVSTDELTWTLTLRPGLRFSDGSRLTSADVKATFDRAMTDKSSAYPALVAPIRSVEAPTPETIVFRLKDPYPSLKSVLAYPAMTILPKAGIERGKAFFGAPISAGPYKLVQWDHADTSTFVVNERYWGPKPVVKRVRLVTVEDFNTRFSQLRSGQIDGSIDFPPSLLPQVEDAPGVESYIVPLYGFMSIDIWDGRPPLDETGVRRAISLAIDRQQINDVIWRGQLTMMSGFWPPTMQGYEPISIERDVAAAKRALAGTACEGGCRVKLEYSPAFSFADQAAAILKQNLAEIGVEVALSKIDLGTWSENHSTGNYELSIGGLTDFANVPDGMLAQGFPEPGGGGLQANFSGWRSKQASAAASRAVRASGSHRSDALAEINRIFVEDQPYVTLGPYSLLVAQRVPRSVMSISPSSLVEIARERATE